MSTTPTFMADIGRFVAGSGFPNELQGCQTGDYPFAKVGDISIAARSGSQFISQANNYLDAAGVKKIGAKVLPKGSILFAKIGEAISQNFRVIAACDMLIDNNAMGFIPDPEKVDGKYIFHFLKSIDFYALASKTTVPAIRKSDLDRIQINLPPLEEQKRIAAILDKADSLRRKRAQAIALADDFLRATFLDLFGDPVTNPKGWPVKKLKEITQAIFSGNTPAGGKENYVEEGIVFLRSQNVWKREIILDDVAFIDEATHKKMKKSSLKYRDILMTKTGRFNTENSSLGRAALFEGEDDTANVNGHVYSIRLQSGMINEFVLYVLTTNEYRDYIRSVCVGGIDKRQINKEHLEEFPIIFPPVDRQREFSELMRRVEKIGTLNAQGAADSDQILQSLTKISFAC